MSNFIVSARKYRPDTFSSVIGQKVVTATLQSALQRDQVAHAYLFCGPRGVGKTTCARIFAKAINCQNRTETAEPCNECESCKLFNQSRSLDVHEFDAASNNSVDDIRNLNEQLQIPPSLGRYSVFIIDEVHMLSTSAFNAFLKTLEEPPSYAIFILATTEKHKILPTILSRCQIFDFKRIQVDDTVNFLKEIAEKEDVTYEDEALNTIATKADGAMRDALSTFDQVVSFSQNNLTYQKTIEVLNLLDINYYFRITDAMGSGDYGEALVVLDEIIAKGFDLTQFLNGLNEHFRNLVLASDAKTIPILEIGESFAERYHGRAQAGNKKLFTHALMITTDAQTTFKNTANQRLLIEVLLITLCKLKDDLKKND